LIASPWRAAAVSLSRRIAREHGFSWVSWCGFAFALHGEMRIIALFFLAGCYATPLTGAPLQAKFEDIVRERSSLEFPCPSEQIAVTDLGGEAFRATGCGLYADYECEYSWSDSNSDNGAFLYVCKRAAQDTPTPLPDGG
jgi:hypothetical protein